MWTKFYKAKEGEVAVFVVSAADGRFAPCFEITFHRSEKMAQAGTRTYATEAKALYAALTWVEEIHPPVDASQETPK